MMESKETMKNDLLEKSLSPMHQFYNGTTTPFGEWEDDGDFHVYYETTSRYGYLAHPIYGVAVEQKHEKGEYVSCRYKIFIGEAPHKDENGDWVTYNKVPSFIIGAFAGADFLKKEPNIPHIIGIQSDEFRQECENAGDKKRWKNEKEIYHLREEIRYCTFKMYIHGLQNRIQKKWGKFSKYKGKHSTIYKYYAPNGTEYVFVNHWEDKSLYFYKEDSEWTYFTKFRDNGKWCFVKEKRTTTEDACEA